MHIGRFVQMQCSDPLAFVGGRKGMVELKNLKLVRIFRLAVSEGVITCGKNKILPRPQHHCILQRLFSKGCAAKRSRRQLIVNNRPQPLLFTASKFREEERYSLGHVLRDIVVFLIT
ncbi:hypothetical protein D3C73_1252050 [compost metagenome]